MNRAVVRALVRRELSMGWLLLVVVLTALAVAAASFPVDVAQRDVLSRLIRRADITLLAVVAVLTAVHVAQRISADRNQRWLEPYAAAGHDVLRYALSLVAIIVLTRLAALTVAVGAFAVAAFVRSGSAELMAGLPLLFGQSALLLACIAAFALCFALLLRDAASAMLTGVVAAAIPLGLVSLHELRNAGVAVPLPLRAWVLCCTPPLHVADSVRAAATDTAWLCAMLLVASLLARSALGRHA